MSNVHLTSDETNRCREAYEAHVEDYATDIFQLRTICADFGQHPSDEQLEVCLRLCGGRVDFNMFCRFALYLKYVYTQNDAMNEEEDDTNCAFAALKEMGDDSVPAARLISTCENFSLRTDFLGGVVEELDADQSGTLSLTEFKELWSRFQPDPGQSILGGISTHSSNSPQAVAKTPRLFNASAPLEKVISAFLRPNTKTEPTEEDAPIKPKRPSLANYRKKTLMFPRLGTSRIMRRESLMRETGGSPDSTGLEPMNPHALSAGRTSIPNNKFNTINNGTAPTAMVPHPPPSNNTVTSAPPGLTMGVSTINNINNTMMGSQFDPTTDIYQPLHLPPIRPRKNKNKIGLQSTVLEKKLEAMKSSRSRFQHNARNMKGFVVHDEIV
eukprot:PhM_4_TR13622/c0_g1_i2/m.63850